MKRLNLLLLLVCTFQTVFSQVYIPYRSGKLWGLADTLGHVVVQPVYDEMNIVSCQKTGTGRMVEIPAAFFVKKEGKYGMIQGTRVVMPPVHSKLYCVDSLFIIDHYSIDDQPVAGSSRDIVYNLKGEQILADTVNAIEALPHAMDKNLLYTIKAPHEKAGLIWYNAKDQKIQQWIVKDVRWVNYGGSYQKEKLFLFLYKGLDKTPQNYDLAFNTQTHLYEVLPPKGAREEPRLVMDNGMGGGSKTIKNNYVIRQFGFAVNGGQVDITMKTQRYHERTETTSKLSYDLKGGTATLQKFMYNATNSQWYNTEPYNNFEKEKVDTVFIYENYVLIRKNKKVGIICGKTVIKPIYDSVSTFKKVGYNIPYFTVAQRSPTDHKLKWGMVSANNKTIIPCIYDELLPTPGSFLWVTRKGSHCGLINAATGKVTAQPVYNKILPINQFGCYRLLLNGKYGYADDRLFCKPKFSFPVDGWVDFQGYKVLYIKNAKDEFDRYADLKGFGYFKN
jgi:hypothetical protein